eukprot:2532216-Rhodomonas_salina.1
MSGTEIAYAATRLRWHLRHYPARYLVVSGYLRHTEDDRLKVVCACGRSVCAPRVGERGDEGGRGNSRNSQVPLYRPLLYQPYAPLYAPIAWLHHRLSQYSTPHSAVCHCICPYSIAAAISYRNRPSLLPCAIYALTLCYISSYPLLHTRVAAITLYRYTAITLYRYNAISLPHYHTVLREAVCYQEKARSAATSVGLPTALRLPYAMSGTKLASTEVGYGGTGHGEVAVADAQVDRYL